MADDDIIKSALEIAMEKVEKLGDATDEERKQWKYGPEGEKLAGRYLNDDANLVSGLAGYDEEVRQYVADAASGVLVRGIDLPRNDAARRRSKRAMEGLQIIKTDKTGLENVFSKISYLFNHYDQEGQQQRDQAYQQLRADMTAQIQHAMQQQMGMMQGNIDVERHPQFQQEWRNLLNQLDNAYLTHLNEYKQELAAVK